MMATGSIDGKQGMCLGWSKNKVLLYLVDKIVAEEAPDIWMETKKT